MASTRNQHILSSDLWFDPRDYNTGYTLGSTITDWTALISNAVAGANAVGGTVLLKQGTYPISANITIPSGVTLKFDPGAKLSGSGTVIFNGDIDAGPCQIFSGSVAAYGGTAKTVDVYPHWWGITPDDNSVDNKDAIENSLQSFVNCNVKFLGATLYASAAGVTTNTATFNARKIVIDGGGAHIICSNTAMSSGAVPFFGVGGGKEITVKNIKVSHINAVNTSADATIGYSHLLSVSGNYPNFAEKILIEDCTAEDGYQCGISIGVADAAIVRNCRVKRVMGSGVYFADIAKLAQVDGAYVDDTGDDSIAFTSDTWVSDGTELATIDNSILLNSYASAIDFAGCIDCKVGPGVYIKNTYGAGIRTQQQPIENYTQQQKTVNIVGATLDHAGQLRLNNVCSNASGNGIAIDVCNNGIVQIKDVIIKDYQNAGIWVLDSVQDVQISGCTICGNYSLANDATEGQYSIFVGQNANAQNIKRCRIVNNVLDKSGLYNFYLAHVDHARLSGNYLKDWGESNAAYTMGCAYATNYVDFDSDNKIDGTASTAYIDRSGDPAAEVRNDKLQGNCGLHGPLVLQANTTYSANTVANAYSVSAGMITVTAASNNADGVIKLPDVAGSMYVIKNLSNYNIVAGIANTSDAATINNGVTSLVVHDGTDYILVS